MAGSGKPEGSKASPLSLSHVSPHLTELGVPMRPCTSPHVAAHQEDLGCPVKHEHNEDLPSWPEYNSHVHHPLLSSSCAHREGQTLQLSGELREMCPNVPIGVSQCLLGC